MALIGDSGAIYALYDRRDRHHKTVRRFIETTSEAIVLPMAILAEIDYLLRVRLGHEAPLRLLEGIEAGAFQLEPLTGADVRMSHALLVKYAALDLGLADASVIATAERLGIRRILTVDERHFRAVRSAAGDPFRLVPADA